MQSKTAGLLMALIMSLGMSITISLFFTLLFSGTEPGFFLRWVTSIGLSFVVAFPSSLVLGPLSRKLADRIVGAGVEKA